MGAKLTLFLRVLVATGLIIAIFASIDLSEVVLTLSSLDPKWLIALCLVAISLRVLKSYKWWLLLRAREIAISPWQSLRLYFEGNIVGILTPAGVGSDLYRVAALSDLRKHTDVISTLMVERLIGYILLVIVAAIALPFSARFIDTDTYRALLGIIGSVFALGLAASLLLQVTGIKELVNTTLIPAVPFLAKVKSVFLTCFQFRHRVTLLISFAMLTLVEIFFLVVVSFAAALSLHIDVPFLFLLTVIPLMHLLIRLPISIQALGVQEGLFVYVLSIAGYTAADGLAISIVLRIVEATLIFLPGVLLLSTRSKLPKPESNSVQKEQNPG